MKVIGICGSSRKNSNSTEMVEQILAGARNAGAEIQLVKLSDLEIKTCDGCLTCDETGKCHFNDGMNKLIEDMVKADGFVFGSPARFDNVSGLMKNFIDRTNPLCSKMLLNGKVTVLVTVGYFEKDISRLRAINSLKYFCDAQGMKVVGSLKFFEGSGKPKTLDNNIRKACFNFGKKLAYSIK